MPPSPPGSIDDQLDHERDKRAILRVWRCLPGCSAGHADEDRMTKRNRVAQRVLDSCAMSLAIANNPQQWLSRADPLPSPRRVSELRCALATPQACTREGRKEWQRDARFGKEAVGPAGWAGPSSCRTMFRHEQVTRAIPGCASLLPIPAAGAPTSSRPIHTSPRTSSLPSPNSGPARPATSRRIWRQSRGGKRAPGGPAATPNGWPRRCSRPGC